MSTNLKILFIGQKQPVAETVLSQFGNVTYGTEPSGADGYDLIALTGDSYTGDFSKLFQTIWESGTSLGVFNITQEQVNVVSSTTGISPSGTPQGVLAARGTHGQNFNQVRYLLQYSQAVMDTATKGGLNATDIINSFMIAGIQAHFQALQSQPAGNVSGAPMAAGGPGPTNFLIPQYSQQPFSIVRIPAKNLSQGVGSMYNLSAVSMQLASQLYCYHENGAGNNDYIVIIVTQLNNISNGNPVSYTKSDFPSCGQCSYNYEWDQYFDYTLKIVAQNGAGAAYTNLTIYDSSPANAGHGQTQLVDSIGVPNPLTIYMQVLNGGTWQLANFPASYTNTINTETVKWFDIKSQNNAGAGAAGVDFNIPTDVTGWYQGEHQVKPVNFEVITVFKFPGSLVSNGKLPVLFQYNINMSATQKYTVLVSCQGGGVPQTTTTNGGGWQSFNTDTYDLVVLTQNQSPTK